MMRSTGFLLMIVLFAGCAAPLPPPIPPQPSTPPLPPPERPMASATVSGLVVDARGMPVSHALVIVRAADASCRPIEHDAGAVSDERGEFVVVVPTDRDVFFSGCVLARAESGGAVGLADAMVEFSTESPRIRLDVRLDRSPLLTADGARSLAGLLANAINDPARHTADLEPHILHGPEALRVGLELYRKVLGRVTDVSMLPREAHDPERFRFEFRGVTGRTSHVDVYREVLTRVHSPLLDYGFRSERFVTAYLRAISSGDAVMLARVLNPDDIDFPVERAREMIVDYRLRYADTATIRAEFVDLNERTSSMTWRLRGAGRAGGEETELIELGFGDGLIGVRGLER